MINKSKEILLANKGFCNLVSCVVSEFKGDKTGMYRALYILARANYRQTCVDLRKDPILQEAWHTNNEHLRLCGVSLTGCAERPDLKEYELQAMQRHTTAAAYSMADELGLPRPKNVTTIKPEGTGAKCRDSLEGIHLPLGKYVLNWQSFGEHNPLLPALIEAGYEHKPSPLDPTATLVCLPSPIPKVDVPFESAITQLERYKLYQNNWTQQNTSVTISYDSSEVPDIIDWLLANWDSYVGVSFLYRHDPTKTAEDLGYAYLPQEVVTKERYEAAVAKIKPFDVDSIAASIEEVEDGEDLSEDCATGVCPVR